MDLGQLLHVKNHGHFIHRQLITILFSVAKFIIILSRHMCIHIVQDFSVQTLKIISFC